jgi:hypothetical protein
MSVTTRRWRRARRRSSAHVFGHAVEMLRFAPEPGDGRARTEAPFLNASDRKRALYE